MKDGYFSARYIKKDTWKISGYGCDCYLLAGNDEAVMIDSACPHEDIRAFAQALTDRPVLKVINTHSHFDHTGGNSYFPEILATEGIARGAKNTMDEDPSKYCLDYEFTIIHDGDLIDIKGRPLRIIELDCHSPENIAVLDERERLLFPGDEIEGGQVLLLPGYAEKKGQIHSCPQASVETYLRALKKLDAYSSCFDQICPGHNGSPIDKQYLYWYMEAAEQILDGHKGSRDCSSPSYDYHSAHFPFPHADYRRYEWKGASLVYCADRIYDRDMPSDPDLPATPLHLMSAYCI